MFSIKFYVPSKAILSHLQYQSCLLPKRTVFDFIKFWKDPRPKVNPADLPYSVVTPAAVSPRRYVPETILKPDYAESGIPGMPPIFPILADDLDVERMRAAGQMARKVLDLAAKEVQVSDMVKELFIYPEYAIRCLFLLIYFIYLLFPWYLYNVTCNS